VKISFLLLLLGVAMNILPAQDDAEPAGLRAVLVVPPENFRDEELIETRKALEAAEISVDLASRAKGTIKGMLGAEIEAAMTLDDALVGLEYTDVVVFIGGSGTVAYFEDEAIMNLIRTAVRQRKLIGAICLAPSLLARACVLEGRTATVWTSESGTLEARGAVYRAQPVVVDGRFVTANGPGAAAAFGEALVSWLTERAASRRKAQELIEKPKQLRAEGDHEGARKLLAEIREKNNRNGQIASNALFETGYCFYAEGRFAAAVRAFLELAAEYPESDFFGMAMFNAGALLHRKLDKPREAIGVFGDLIDGDCNDWDDTGELMNPYRN